MANVIDHEPEVTKELASQHGLTEEEFEWILKILAEALPTQSWESSVSCGVSIVVTRIPLPF